MTKILAPATSFEAAVGVIDAGADEIYCGVKIPKVKYPGLSTRIYRASLQTYDELGTVVRYAHDHDVETIVTLEFPFMAGFLERQMRAHARACAEEGVDAFIAGDLGLILALKEMHLGVPIYASTYLATMNYEAADLLKKLGVKRVILERHVTVEEIREIVERSKGVEVEVFVHGPGCSNINVNCYGCTGGIVKPLRPGLKGLLTPTCRVTYEVYQIGGGKRRKLTEAPILDAYSFCSICRLPDLIKTGVTGIKIVGRDGPQLYQIWVTRMYRELVDLVESNQMELFQKELESIRGRNDSSLWVAQLTMPEACEQKRCYYSPFFHAPYKLPRSRG